MNAFCGILQVQNLTVWIIECRDPSYAAFKLGFAAAALLAFAHVIANFLGGCHCVRSREELDVVSYNKRLAFASLVLSWYRTPLPMLYNLCKQFVLDSLNYVPGLRSLLDSPC